MRDPMWAAFVLAALWAGPILSTPVFGRRLARRQSVQVARAEIDVGPPLSKGFISFSIEFASFPDFAGNKSHPNQFSDTLLNNIAALQGVKPYIRVGGKTQDYALLNAYLEQALNGTVGAQNPTAGQTTLQYGPPFVESYRTFGNTKFIHGFNLALSDGSFRENLRAGVNVVCRALQNDNLLFWELGNEPDLYTTPPQRPVREGTVGESTWDEETYVKYWSSVTKDIRQAMSFICPDLTSTEKFKFIAPSFAGTANRLDPLKVWEKGLKDIGEIAEISSHTYMGVAGQQGVTLEGTLMNHTQTKQVVSQQADLAGKLSYLKRPFILGEVKNLSNRGTLGISDTFGAALWLLDFVLMSAVKGISRVHLHQGTDHFYSAWQPVATKTGAIATKPLYYGTIAAAAMIGNIAGSSKVRIAQFPLSDKNSAAYAAYENRLVQRLMVINLRPHGRCSKGNREVKTYNFQLQGSCSGTAKVSRLMADGSDSVTGINWDNTSYDYDRDQGKPVRLNSTEEAVSVGENGSIFLDVPASSAAMVELSCGQ